MFVCDVGEIPKRELYINIKNDYNLLHEGAHVEMLYKIVLNGKRKMYSALSICYL